MSGSEGVEGRRETTRERILSAASELFYRTGVHPSAVDQVVERAGISKPTLYQHFGSKDRLVTEVLRRWDRERREVLRARLDDEAQDPRERLLAVFDWLREWIAGREFRGCGLVKLGVELGDDPEKRAVVSGHKAWVRERFEELCRDADVAEPGAAADRLLLLMEGATVLAAVGGGELTAPGAARAGAEAILARADG